MTFYGLKAIFVLFLVHRGRMHIWSEVLYPLASGNTGTGVGTVVSSRVTIWVAGTIDFFGFFEGSWRCGLDLSIFLFSFILGHNLEAGLGFTSIISLSWITCWRSSEMILSSAAGVMLNSTSC